MKIDGVWHAFSGDDSHSTDLGAVSFNAPLAANSTNLYGGETGAIERMSENGGASSVVVSATPITFAVDENCIYYVTENGKSFSLHQSPN